MKLIVGLWNPGAKYENTRHNAGFLMLDAFAKWEKMKRTKHKEWNAEVTEWTIRDEKVVMCKPLTYMNSSGESVGKIAKFYKIKPENIIVLHDEIDIPNADIKLKVWGGHAGHNGLKSMIAHLGTNTFSRIRIGVGRPATKEEVVDYVLTNFSKTEWKAIEEKESLVFDMIYEFVG